MVTIDYFVIGIILAGGLIGFCLGIVKTAYKIVSFALSVFIAAKFSVPLSNMIKTTEFYHNLLDKTYQSLQGKVLGAGLSVMDGIVQIIGQLPLPDNIKPVLIQKSAEDAVKVTQESGSPVFAVSTGLTDFLTTALAGILLFVFFRILFAFIGRIINKMSKAPVIKQIDRSIGLILGCLIGLIFVFILFMAITLFAASDKMASLIALINDSTVAHYLYNHNPINRLLAKKS